MILLIDVNAFINFCFLVFIFFSDESSIGVIQSKARNVGKSMTLRLLAKGEGVAIKPHPLLCSGGDQNISGCSL